MTTAVAELTVLVMLAAGCSSGNVARVSDECDLLTSSEVADNIHADADPGVLTSASNETETRICSFKVGGQLGAVLVYLGAGVAPATAQNDAPVHSRGSDRPTNPKHVASDDGDTAGERFWWLSIRVSTMVVTVGTRWSAGRSTMIPGWLPGG